MAAVGWLGKISSHPEEGLSMSSLQYFKSFFWANFKKETRKARKPKWGAERLKNVFTKTIFTTTDCLWWGWNALHNGLITSHSWLCHKFVVRWWLQRRQRGNMGNQNTISSPLGRRLFCPITIFSFWFLGKCIKEVKIIPTNNIFIWRRILSFLWIGSALHWQWEECLYSLLLTIIAKKLHCLQFECVYAITGL